MKTQNILFVLLVILTASFIGCDKDTINPQPTQFTISGTVYDTAGYPLSGVNICLHDTINNLFSNSQTDINGFYVCVVDSNWCGKIVPAKVGGFVFKPSVWYYNNVSFNHEHQDYWQLKPL